MISVVSKKQVNKTYPYTLGGFGVVGEQVPGVFRRAWTLRQPRPWPPLKSSIQGKVVTLSAVDSGLFIPVNNVQRAGIGKFVGGNSTRAVALDRVGL